MENSCNLKLIPIGAIKTRENGIHQDIELQFNKFILHEYGLFDTSRQADFFFEIAKSTPETMLEHPYSDCIDYLKQCLRPNEIVLYQIYQNKRSGTKSLFSFFLDQKGIRLKLISSWAWTEKVGTSKICYNREKHNRMYAWRREKNAGDDKKNYVLKYKGTLSLFIRKHTM